MANKKFQPKLVKDQAGDEWLIIGEFEGLIEEGEDICFTINLAPDECQGFTETKNHLVAQASFYQKAIELLDFLGNTVECETDYYWGEGDLNLRICTSKENPAIEHLFK